MEKENTRRRITGTVPLSQCKLSQLFCKLPLLLQSKHTNCHFLHMAIGSWYSFILIFITGIKPERSIVMDDVCWSFSTLGLLLTSEYLSFWFTLLGLCCIEQIPHLDVLDGCSCAAVQSVGQLCYLSQCLQCVLCCWIFGKPCSVHMFCLHRYKLVVLHKMPHQRWNFMFYYDGYVVYTTIFSPHTPTAQSFSWNGWSKFEFTKMHLIPCTLRVWLSQYCRGFMYLPSPVLRLSNVKLVANPEKGCTLKSSLVLQIDPLRNDLDLKDSADCNHFKKVFCSFSYETFFLSKYIGREYICLVGRVVEWIWIAICNVSLVFHVLLFPNLRFGIDALALFFCHCLLYTSACMHFPLVGMGCPTLRPTSSPTDQCVSIHFPKLHSLNYR